MDDRLLVTVIFIQAVILLLKTVDGDLTTTSRCQGQYLNLNCGPSAILLFASATYGRTERDTCGAIGKSSCYKDVQLKMKRMCSGRQECHTAVIDEQFDNPCHGEKAELTVTYKCVSEHSVTDQCVNEPVELTSDIGYIVSPHYPFPYQDDIQCNWKLILEQGQHVNLTTYDFELDGRRNARCYDYLAIFDDTKTSYRDNQQKILFMDCGIVNGGYLQSSPGASEVQIQFVSHDKTRSRGFIIEYNVYGREKPKIINPVPGKNIPDESDVENREIDEKNKDNTSHIITPPIISADIPQDEIRPTTTRGDIVQTIMTSTILPIKPEDQELEELNSPSFGIGIIVGVVASLALLLVIAVLAIVFYRRYKYRFNKPATPYYVNESAANQKTLLPDDSTPLNPVPPDEIDKGRTIVMEIQGDRITKLYPGTGRNSNTLTDPPDKPVRLVTLKNQDDSVIYAKPEMNLQRSSLPGGVSLPPGMYDDGYITDALSLNQRQNDPRVQRDSHHDYATIEDAHPYAVSDITHCHNCQTIPRNFPCNPASADPNRQSRKYYDYDQAFSTMGHCSKSPPPPPGPPGAGNSYYSPVGSAPSNNRSNNGDFSTFLQRQQRHSNAGAELSGDIFETNGRQTHKCQV
ncbi:uncharacterized protein LOC141899979 [Tubulanus polymorphus]|uniref:uncharacterized protein LOC141899979 n=1 Tax=Tubulanus polymorphus TaxID=672921 RepID=UPI003DA2D782